MPRERSAPSVHETGSEEKDADWRLERGRLRIRRGATFHRGASAAALRFPRIRWTRASFYRALALQVILCVTGPAAWAEEPATSVPADATAQPPDSGDQAP
ncbi:MAG TPA: hypothetical protein DEP35_20795, partial [Deltaproteobacteria bacterium]|nr:hypothetical protein [Deltaproteobacteria bacterium]